jgi:flagellar M-ring protein FliF
LAIVVRDFWSELGNARKAGFVSASVAIVVLAVAVLSWTLNEPYTVLFSELEEQDAGRVITQLESMKRSFRLGDSGSSILVPENEVHDIRIRLMSTGMPLAGGVGFEIFDDTGFGMTEFAQRINYQRALEGELTRTIMALDEVKFARVHIVMPEGGLFQSEQGAPSAAVTLFLKNGRQPSAGQIEGAQSLVAAAVPRLEPMQVTVTDQNGLTLSQIGADGSVARMSGQLEQKMEVERYLAQKVNNMLAGAFGPNQAMVSVDVMLNFNESTTTTESIVPSAGVAETGVLRRRESRPSGDRRDSGNGGNTTTEIEYQLGRSVEQMVVHPGRIVRLSVGVVVPAGTSEQRRQAIGELISATVGFDKGRGDAIAIYSLAAPGIANSGLEIAASVAAEAEVTASSSRTSTIVAISERLRDLGVDQTTLTMVLRLVGLSIVVLLLAWLLHQRQARRLAPTRRLSGPERDQLVCQVQDWLKEEPAAEQRSTIS